MDLHLQHQLIKVYIVLKVYITKLSYLGGGGTYHCSLSLTFSFRNYVFNAFVKKLLQLNEGLKQYECLFCMLCILSRQINPSLLYT